ncbi:GNAT family N-acetyltransferase [Spirosoma sp. KCTC 42546]|uniref:GNAT family N-acetyltransferase n=1 Tax=Spirosoma sp. KCTC 42546 TaxID=2520506 RepID=UPI00115A29C7|nr:GNAT family N-acetyltransferase [Spirosoma sp. KCTC 42546]QDK82267.1 GNAT family N-acetyltransferase [Spirosoma sp. KCTC 42546]
MTIRSATISDAASLTELAATTMREAFGPPHNPTELVEEYIQSAISVPVMEAELTDRRSFFFLVESSDGQPVGYAKLRQHAPPRRMTHRNAIEIQRIYLLQNQIGQGQGRMLMEYCLNWARGQGYDAVWLGVWERNGRAIAFYERMGFERFGFHYFQFGTERQRDFWLQKQLIS